MECLADLGIFVPHLSQSDNHLKEFVALHCVSDPIFYLAVFGPSFGDVGCDKCAVDCRLVAAEGIFFNPALHHKIAVVHQPNARVRAHCDQINEDFFDYVSFLQDDLVAHFELQCQAEINLRLLDFSRISRFSNFVSPR